jgi:hypothetical protein
MMSTISTYVGIFLVTLFSETNFLVDSSGRDHGKHIPEFLHIIKCLPVAFLLEDQLG